MRALKYVSTRGSAPEIGFNEALLTGLASDGGLYVPQFWPQLDARTISAFAGMRFQDIAKTVLQPFVEGEISQGDLAKIIEDAYAGFSHPAIAPLVQISHNQWILELFHGPTLAFKDVAMQMLARLMDRQLSAGEKRATIVGATSGDTGGAAIDAFAGRDNIDLFILFPEGKVSPVQQRQMTTVGGAEVFPLAVKGTFDDCQTIVKSLFGNRKFCADVALSGVNSINWARIMAQIVYYFSSAASLGAPHSAVSFCVPSGNFGDIFAGYAASRMGLPIDRLVIATNQNDILARALNCGRYEVGKVYQTTSPSMDIQISSNFERLLFEASERDAHAIVRLMGLLQQSGGFTIDQSIVERIRRDFSADCCEEPEVARTIAKTLANCGYLADPHTAVGLKVAATQQKEGIAMVTLATAHPAKFPAAVQEATGVDPKLPPWLGDLMDRKERYDTIANDPLAVERYIYDHSRAMIKV